MKIRFVNIILLTVLLFPFQVSHASIPSGGDKNDFFTHGMLACLDCHSRIKTDSDHPSVEDSSTSCGECHDSFAGFPHSEKYTVDCLDCHSRHNEKILHDAHAGVTCRVCHLYDIKIEREMNKGIPVWKYKPGSAGEYDPHRMITGNEKICSRCHFKGNSLGAPDYLLPAKSIICMPCHAATFSSGGTLSSAAIIIFLIGIVSTVFMWASSGRTNRKHGRRKSVRISSIIKALFLDGFLQRKLFKISRKRWIIHGMIFFPFVFRFMWGIVALLLSLFDPEWNAAWFMIDKNNPTTGFIFDITGIMILTGGCLMVIEKRKNNRIHGIKGLPESRVSFTALLGGIIITGFIVEAARIAMTGTPKGSQFAFIGYLISRILSDYHMNGIYAYLWYLHAATTAVLIACLPFTRMFHVFIAPLGMLLKGPEDD